MGKFNKIARIDREEEEREEEEGVICMRNYKLVISDVKRVMGKVAVKK